MALPALPPLLTSPIATTPPLAADVATPPFPAEAISVSCMMVSPPVSPPRGWSPSSILRPPTAGVHSPQVPKLAPACPCLVVPGTHRGRAQNHDYWRWVKPSLDTGCLLEGEVAKVRLIAPERRGGWWRCAGNQGGQGNLDGLGDTGQLKAQGEHQSRDQHAPAEQPLRGPHRTGVCGAPPVQLSVSSHRS